MIYFKNGSYILSTIELNEGSSIDDEDIYSDSDRNADTGCVLDVYYESIMRVWWAA